MKVILLCLIAYLTVALSNVYAYPTIPSGTGIQEWEPNRDYNEDTLVWERTTENIYYSITPAHTSSPTFIGGDEPNWREISDDLDRLPEGTGITDAVTVWSDTTGDKVRTSGVFIDSDNNVTGVRNLTVAEDLVVEGIGFFNSDIVGAGDISLSNDILVGGDALILGDLETEGSLVVSETATVQGDLFLNGLLDMAVILGTPTAPFIDRNLLFFRDDNRLYRMDSLGVEALVGLNLSVTDDNRLIRSDGSGGDSIQESGITVNDDDSLENITYLELININTPAAPATGNTSIYTKLDGKLYRQDELGNESLVGLDLTSNTNNAVIVSSGTAGEALQESVVILDPITGDITGVNDLSLTGTLEVGDQLNLAHNNTPTVPLPGNTAYFTRDDGTLYRLDEFGVETLVGLELSSTAPNRLVRTAGADGSSLQDSEIEVTNTDILGVGVLTATNLIVDRSNGTGPGVDLGANGCIVQPQSNELLNACAQHGITSWDASSGIINQLTGLGSGFGGSSLSYSSTNAGDTICTDLVTLDQGTLDRGLCEAEIYYNGNGGGFFNFTVCDDTDCDEITPVSLPAAAIWTPITARFACKAQMQICMESTTPLASIALDEAYLGAEKTQGNDLGASHIGGVSIGAAGSACTWVNSSNAAAGVAFPPNGACSVQAIRGNVTSIGTAPQFTLNNARAGTYQIVAKGTMGSNTTSIDARATIGLHDTATNQVDGFNLEGGGRLGGADLNGFINSERTYTKVISSDQPSITFELRGRTTVPGNPAIVQASVPSFGETTFDFDVYFFPAQGSASGDGGIGEVSTSGTKRIRRESCHVTNNGSASLDVSDSRCSDWITSVTRTVVGQVDFVLSFTPTSRPNCNLTPMVGNRTIGFSSGGIPTAGVNSFIVQTFSTSSISEDRDFNITCDFLL